MLPVGLLAASKGLTASALRPLTQLLWGSLGGGPPASDP